MSTTTLTKEKKQEIFHSVEEVVSKYFPNDLSKETMTPGDFGKQLANDAVDRIKKGIRAIKPKK